MVTYLCRIAFAIDRVFRSFNIAVSPVKVKLFESVGA